ncbi:MAG: UDP-N-acetylmuramoyl-L-alanyl-D-glutamate--2,6-diaminopimelate ligase [Betaproteobacteria bacterium]|nr:UDP-N-acetylmuramoyl-L-alanyl-D-glutamate--2,6-diaminopimelate ligase [Betaproteobacteria bacterium]
MIERLCSDSRAAGPGTAFFAYPGETSDGRRFIPDALQRGVSAVVWEERAFEWRPEWRLPNVAVRDLKAGAGELAGEFYGRPSDELWVCGVTGTNGKSSCSHWIAAALSARAPGAVVGTLGYGEPGKLAPLPNTTPDALELQRLLRGFVDAGKKVVAMEVSSHGLVQGRVSGIAFDCALFTNLSHDHLDYHGSMEAYGEAKARLFDVPGLSAAVINVDDAFGAQLAQRTKSRLRVIGYGWSTRPVVEVDEYLAPTLLEGVDTGQVGRFNVLNVLGVVGVLRAYGLTLDEALASVRKLPRVPGRMEKIGERPMVVVDYAHTPDALEKVLAALRPAAEQRGGKLVVVFGAGGDRDPAKRPIMGEVAARLADRVFVTSDNPRGEDPLAIIAAIERGMRGAHEREPDRREAIAAAVRSASEADVVLIAGKGHEEYQEIAGRREPFSDAGAARDALASRGGR